MQQMSKSPEMRKLILELDNKIPFAGFWDNSFEDYTYSEYRVKNSLMVRLTDVFYIPFTYKGKRVWVTTERIITKLP